MGIADQSSRGPAARVNRPFFDRCFTVQLESARDRAVADFGGAAAAVLRRRRRRRGRYAALQEMDRRYREAEQAYMRALQARWRHACAPCRRERGVRAMRESSAVTASVSGP